MNSLILLALLVLLTYLGFRHQRVFTSAVLVLAVLEGANFNESIAFTVSTFRVQVHDLVMLAAAVSAAVGMRRLPIRSWWGAAFATLVAILGIALLVGIAQSGLQPSVNAFRTWLLFAALLAWALTRPRAWVTADLHAVTVAAGVAVGALVVGTIRDGIHTASDLVEVNGNPERATPLMQYAALMLLLGLIVVAVHPEPLDRLRIPVMAAFVVSIVLAQVRSVWLATLVASIVLVLGRRGASAGTLGRALPRSRRGRTWLVAGLVGVMAAASVFSGVLRASSTSTDTLTWRITGWVEGLEIPRTLLQWLVGAAGGPYTLFTEKSDTIEYAQLTSVHSSFVYPLASLGLLGLVAFLMLVTAPLWCPALVTTPWSATLRVAVVLALITFGVFYMLPSWSALLIGILTAGTVLPRAAAESMSAGAETKTGLAAADP